MGKLVRWGIIGAGVMARHFAEDLTHCSNGVFHGITSRTPQRAQSLAAEFNGVAFASIAELLADPNIDAVYIATPNSLHAEHTKLALHAGKPVLCEKPFAIDAEEAKEVVSIAKAKKVFCMEAMWTRFLPTIRNVVSEIESGTIGSVRSLRAELGFPIAYSDSNRFSTSELGGGAFLDLGVYAVSIAQSILGTPTDIAASMHWESGVDVHGTALLTYPDAQAVLIASHASELTNTLTIAGEKGRITVSSPFIRGMSASLRKFERQPPNTRISQDGSLKRVLKSTGAWPIVRKIGQSVLQSDRSLSKSYPGHGYHFQAKAVGDALARGDIECEVMALDDTISVMEMLTEIGTLSRSQ